MPQLLCIPTRCELIGWIPKLFMASFAYVNALI
jgi:hypothetical protein